MTTAARFKEIRLHFLVEGEMGSLGHKELDDRLVALATGNDKSRLALAISGVQRSSVGDQSLDNFKMVVSAGEKQRSVSFQAQGIDVCAFGDQKIDEFQMSSLASKHQWALGVVFFFIDVGHDRRQKKTDSFEVISLARNDQSS